jgi:hypothetical protein
MLQDYVDVGCEQRRTAWRVGIVVNRDVLVLEVANEILCLLVSRELLLVLAGVAGSSDGVGVSQAGCVITPSDGERKGWLAPIGRLNPSADDRPGSGSPALQPAPERNDPSEQHESEPQIDGNRPG